MTIVNAIVIYFALGVPFGVLTVAIISQRVAAHDLLRILYNLLFWPFIALGWFLNCLKPQAVRDSDTVYGRFVTDEVARSGDRNFRRHIDTQFAILSGLKKTYAEAVAAKEIQAPFHGIWPHPDPNIAAKCFQRRNIDRIEKRIRSVEDDLSRLVYDSDAPSNKIETSVAIETLQLDARFRP